MVDVILGMQWGDEGKGKIIAYLARRDKPSVAVRGGVGPNAGHTFVCGGKTHKVRMLPSAVLNWSRVRCPKRHASYDSSRSIRSNRSVTSDAVTVDVEAAQLVSERIRVGDGYGYGRSGGRCEERAQYQDADGCKNVDSQAGSDEGSRSNSTGPDNSLPQSAPLTSGRAQSGAP